MTENKSKTADATQDELYAEIASIMREAESACAERLEQFNLINARNPSAPYTDAKLGWYFVMKPGSD